MALSEEQKKLAQQYAEENIRSGLNCSESVFNALLRSKVVNYPEELTALVSGLNGGVGSAGYSCGALASAMIALGSVYGRKDPIKNRGKILNDSHTAHCAEKPEDDFRYYSMRRFNACVEEFKQKMGTLRCQDVIDANGGYYSPDRQAKCEQMIHCGVEVALKYIDMEQEEADKLPYCENIFGWK